MDSSTPPPRVSEVFCVFFSHTLDKVSVFFLYCSRGGRVTRARGTPRRGKGSRECEIGKRLGVASPVISRARGPCPLPRPVIAILWPETQRNADDILFDRAAGNTEAAADWISQKFEGDISDPTDIGEIDVGDLAGYSGLIVGAPTWNTGADEGRSGTAWDEVIDEIKDLDLSGKKVAVFGCGDSSSYGDYFCDAIEEVYSAMKEAGAEMVGSVATDGYDFSESKSVIDGKFCGLPLDEDNESDMTEERVAAWCAQIAGEGLA